VISKNKLFVSETWTNKAEEERRASFKWARNSKPAKRVRKMANDWIQLTKAAEKEAISKRAEKKMKKNVRSLKLLEKCKLHGGPLTASDNDLKLLETLSEPDLLNEICYIRCTLDPNIRQKRKENGKFVQYTASELRSQIKMRLRPESDTNHCLDTLISTALGVPVADIQDEIAMDSDETITEHTVGVTGWWHGPLGERQVGVLLTTSSIQMYKKSNYGFVPEGFPISTEGWVLNETIPEENVHYVMRRDKVFLKF
jgi:hypothetical protein